MNTRVLTVLNSVLLATTLALGFAAPGLAGPQDKPATNAEAKTEDVLHMTDGRVLRGQIISETRSEVVFEYRDPNLNLNAKMTVVKENIALIERDQPVAGAPAETPESTPEAKPSSGAPRPSTSTKSKPTSSSMTDFGIARVNSDSPNVPSLYVVPFKGQMGTDIRSSEYKKLIEDIRAAKPTVIVLEIKSGDSSDMMFPEGYDTPPVPDDVLEDIRKREWGMLEFEDYRALVHVFRNELRDIQQVVWVHDSDGISATIVMAWPDLYMTPTARLGAKLSVLQQSNAKKWGDPDVRAKMIAAWGGMAKGFLERGGYSLALADAMLDETPVLSGKWKGREVIWTLDDSGDYVVDGSDKHAAYFTAKTAEDFCISDGTAETLDDLALLLGFREYRVIESEQEKIDEYVAGWRKAFMDSQDLFKDFQQHMGWASGEDTLKWLSKAKSDIDKILDAMERYPAVQVRWERDFGVPKLYFVTLSERLKEQITALKKVRNVGGGGGGSTGGGGRMRNN